VTAKQKVHLVKRNLIFRIWGKKSTKHDFSKNKSSITDVNILYTHITLCSFKFVLYLRQTLIFWLFEPFNFTEWVNNQVEPASVQPTKTLLEESVATTDFIKVEI
jgi:hypothetical protein